jgi:hypothetical protein
MRGKSMNALLSGVFQEGFVKISFPEGERQRERERERERESNMDTISIEFILHSLCCEED